MTSERDPPCAEWSPLLHALVDGELDAANSLRCEAHLAACAACAAELTELQAMRAVLASEGVAWSAPASLRERILASIGEEGARASEVRKPAPKALAPAWLPRLRWPAGPWGAMPAGLALAASVLLAIMATRPDEGADLSNQLVAGHVRSLLASHLTDVQTSDQHTVKPWFSGKIDFSPPVVDLGDRGFPLVGGRLDYMENRVVAALIYMRHKHVINLFMWLSDARLQPAVAKEGYTLLGWQKAGLTFWAVSDLNPVELGEFRDDFTERASR